MDIREALAFAKQCAQFAKEANVPFNLNFNLNFPFSLFSASDFSAMITPSVNPTSDVGSSSSPASDNRPENDFSSVSPESNSGNTRGRKIQRLFAEDITPVQEEKPADIIDSIIFTKKAKKEGMIKTIIQAFKTALSRRRDKSRALAQEVQIWQDDEYLDAHYNAQVMYDEIAKIIPLPFGYEAFKQHYNHTRK